MSFIPPTYLRKKSSECHLSIKMLFVFFLMYIIRVYTSSLILFLCFMCFQRVIWDLISSAAPCRPSVTKVESVVDPELGLGSVWTGVSASRAQRYRRWLLPHRPTRNGFDWNRYPACQPVYPPAPIRMASIWTVPLYSKKYV